MSATLTGVFDREALVARLEGDDELVQEIVALFVEDGYAQLDRLGAAAAASDLPALARAAHAMKGAAANVSALRATEVARRLEHAAQEGRSAEASDCVAELRAAFSAFREAVRTLGIVLPPEPHG